MKTKNMTTSQLRNSVNRSPLRRGFVLIPLSLLLTCFALMPMAQAVGPDTEGAIAGSNNGEGIGVLVSRTSGIWNSGTGFEALNHLTSGNQNTATGLRALFSDTNGGFNTATGVLSLFSNTSGFFNSATGAYSLANNTIGNNNTANGYSALYYNTEGEANTATGFAALYRNTTGFRNTAIGTEALSVNTASFNTAVGYRALFSNTTGEQNMATGLEALFSNTTGNNNTAIGQSALISNITGTGNTAIGDLAGASLTGNGNVCIGRDVVGVAGESDTTRIRNIGSTPIVGGANVVVDGTGGIGDQRLGYASSSRRYKEDIKRMDKASETLFALKPVIFRAKGKMDRARVRHYGLIAEDVAAVDSDLVVYNPEGKPETLRFDSINAMLLNEFLKEHRTVQQQGAVIAELKQEIANLAVTVKEQATQIQKVSAQIEVSKSTPQVVLNKP